MGRISNSIRQILRTPLRSVLFLILISLSAALLTVGAGLFLMSDQNMKRLEAEFTTIGLVSQTADKSEPVRFWDAEQKEYSEWFSQLVYSSLLTPEILDFPGADYIQAPVHRPYYGAYDPSFTYPDNNYIRLIAQTRVMFPIVEVTPLEDCVPDHTVRLKLVRELYGINGNQIRQAEEWETVLFCDHYNPDPQTLYAGKTYVMALQWRQSHQEWVDTHTGVDQLSGEYSPREDSEYYILSTQYSPDGERIPDSMPMDTGYDEVTEGFYDTPRGQRWLELAKAMDMLEHTIPVIPTDSTELLMSFYNGNSTIVDGRDISEDEYRNGERVCLISQEFAKMHGYAIGDTMPLPLYYADYCDSASRDFPPDGLAVGNPNHMLNAEGKCYEVFENQKYTIVGIYNEINKASSSNGYDMAGYGVVIPGASVTNSDANNILDYGPMKGFNTVFQIPNGSIEKYEKEWGKLGIEGLKLTFYDRGYTQIKAGLDQIKQIAFAMFVTGFLITVLILLFFCNLFIGKQKKRTAIERSLGMGKPACAVSLLSGVLVIVTMGSVIGSTAGGLLSGYAMELLSDPEKSAVFSTEFSNWVHAVADAQEMQIAAGMAGPLTGLLCGIFIILLAFCIAMLQIRGNLKSEPLKLLSTRDS